MCVFVILSAVRFFFFLLTGPPEARIFCGGGATELAPTLASWVSSTINMLRDKRTLLQELGDVCVLRYIDLVPSRDEFFLVNASRFSQGPMLTLINPLARSSSLIHIIPKHHLESQRAWSTLIVDFQPMHVGHSKRW